MQTGYDWCDSRSLHLLFNQALWHTLPHTYPCPVNTPPQPSAHTHSIFFTLSLWLICARILLADRLLDHLYLGCLSQEHPGGAGAAHVLQRRASRGPRPRASFMFICGDVKWNFPSNLFDSHCCSWRTELFIIISNAQHPSSQCCANMCSHTP